MSVVIATVSSWSLLSRLSELDFFHPSFSLLRDDKWIDTQVLRIHSEKKQGLLRIYGGSQ